MKRKFKVFKCEECNSTDEIKVLEGDVKECENCGSNFSLDYKSLKVASHDAKEFSKISFKSWFILLDISSKINVIKQMIDLNLQKETYLPLINGLKEYAMEKKYEVSRMNNEVIKDDSTR